MEFLDRLLGRQPSGERIFSEAMRFGRFSDAYRSEEQNEAFDRAVEAFKKGDFFTACRHFFDFLRHPGEDNVEYHQEGGCLTFTIYHGSRAIHGRVTPERFFARTRLATGENYPPRLLRRMLEENFQLRYARFALTPEGDLAMVFESPALDASPYKLYPGLKELAVFSDKNDDLLLEEFPELTPLDQAPRRPLPAHIQHARLDFAISAIRRALDRIERAEPDPARYPIGYSFLLLSTAYEIDYLAKPEGYLMERLEVVHRIAFQQNDSSAAQKNERIRQEFEKILERPRERLLAELYDVPATFGITSPIDHARLALAIESELPQMNWYIENGFEDLALAVPTYIASHSLFYYALPPPDRALLHLLLHVIENDFFVRIGLPSLLRNGLPDRRSIRNAVQYVRKQSQARYPRMQPDIRILDYSTLPNFAASFLRMIQHMKLDA